MPAASNLTIEKPCLLVVEGESDAVIFGKLIEGLQLENIQIHILEGKNKLTTNWLRAIKATSGHENLRSLAIVTDADKSEERGANSIFDMLRNAGLPVPSSPLISAGSAPKVTVMILPGEGRPGMIEDLCLNALGDDPTLSCIDDFFECLKREKLPLPANLSKARMWVFGAAKKPGRPLTGLATDNYWSWNHLAFDPAKKFLRVITEDL